MRVGHGERGGEILTRRGDGGAESQNCQEPHLKNKCRITKSPMSGVERKHRSPAVERVTEKEDARARRRKHGKTTTQPATLEIRWDFLVRGDRNHY